MEINWTRTSPLPVWVNETKGFSLQFQLVALPKQQGLIIRSEFIFTVPKNTPHHDTAILYPLQTHGLFWIIKRN